MYRIKRLTLKLFIFFSLGSTFGANALQFAPPNYQGFNGTNPNEGKVKTVVQEALNIWGDLLDDCPPLIVNVQLIPMGAGTAAAASPSSPTTINHGMLNGDPLTMYPMALGVFLSNARISNPQGFAHDILIQINSTALANGEFFLGLDNPKPGPESSRYNLLYVLLHEIAHALGFKNLTANINSGTANWPMPPYGDFTGIFEKQIIAEDPTLLGTYIPFADDVNLTVQARIQRLTGGNLYWRKYVNPPNLSQVGKTASNSPYTSHTGISSGYVKIHVYNSFGQPGYEQVLSHFLLSASPLQLLMEPEIAIGPKSGGVDLTLPALIDMGYKGSGKIALARNANHGPTRITTTSTLNFALQNPFAETLTFTGWSISGAHASQFGVSSIGTLSDRDREDVPITFTPTSYGHKEADLTITYTRPGNPDPPNYYTYTNTIKLIGIGLLDFDNDGDRIQDSDETIDLDPYTGGNQNPFNNLDADSIGENGSNVQDGFDDGWNDYDGDGLVNMDEFTYGYNPIVPNPSALITDDDTDGDRIPNVYENYGVDWDHRVASPGVQQLDPFWCDNMGDNFVLSPNNVQDGLDDWDADGIANYIDGFTDNDYPVGDGLLAYEDYDSDGDGIDDSEETDADQDGDGTPNFLDWDSDGDNILDIIEGFGNPDGDALPNYLDLDSDEDGYSDNTEYFLNGDPYDYNIIPVGLPVAGSTNPLYFFVSLVLCLVFSGAAAALRRKKG